MFSPSPEQQAILDWVASNKQRPGKKALAVRARAGAGKTTIIREIVVRNSANGIYCAFNTDIVKDVEPKLKGTGVQPKTFHSMGNSTLLKAINVQRANPNARKYSTIAERLMRESASAGRTLPREDERAVPHLMEQMAHWCRVKLLAWSAQAVMPFIDTQTIANVSDPGLAWAMEYFPRLMKEAEQATREGSIDFTDMIYWISRWDLKPPTYPWVLVDEAQDLNPMQRDMVRRSLAEDGFIVIVGDDRQAIYAFAGADSDSFDITCEMFKAHVLPMTVTRRCAAHIVEEAAQIVPDFRAADGAQAGSVAVMHADDLHKRVQQGDMVLCRLKAPLMATALSLIANNIPASIAGRDMAKGLTKLVEAIWRKAPYGSAWSDFPKFAAEYALGRAAALKAKGDEQGAEAVQDEVEAIMAVYESRLPSDKDALCNQIEGLFSDAQGGVKLATVHKSKGLEADTVYIIAPKKLPLIIDRLDKEGRPVQTPEQRQQEMNLAYVAKTRAKKALIYVWEENPPPQAHYVRNLSPDSLRVINAASPQAATVQQADIPTEGIPAAPAPSVPSVEVLVSPTGETPEATPALAELPKAEPPKDEPPTESNALPSNTPTRASTQAALHAALRKLSLAQAISLREVLDTYIADLLQAGAK